eukprot:CFRG0884T1
MILYACVARDAVVLAEHNEARGNIDQVSALVLEKIPVTDTKMSYQYDRFMFHYISLGGIQYLCMSEKDFPRDIAFSFLVEIKTQFLGDHGDDIDGAEAYQFNRKFAPKIQQQMEYFSSDPNADRLRRVRNEVDDVRKVMVQNIEKVIQRGEQIDILVDQTDTLNQHAFQFKKKSTALKRKMWWKNTKMLILLGLVLLIMFYFFLSMACGGPSLPCFK